MSPLAFCLFVLFQCWTLVIPIYQQTCPEGILQCDSNNQCISCHESCGYCQCIDCSPCGYEDCMTCADNDLYLEPLYPDGSGICHKINITDEVYCPDGHIRLVQGETEQTPGLDTIAGRVEIYHRSEWGTICNDLQGTYHNANDDSSMGYVFQIICNELGYATVDGYYFVDSDTPYGEGNGRIWLDTLVCNDTNSRIIECNHEEWGSTDCAHTEDISVICTDYVYNDTDTFDYYNCSIETVEASLCCACDILTQGGGCKADALCESLVCTQDDYCCNTGWDGPCIDTAMNICNNQSINNPTDNKSFSPCYANYSCDYHLDIYPSETDLTSEIVRIIYPNPTYDPPQWNIYFTPRNNDCESPSISFSFIGIDNQNSDEFIWIYDNNDTVLEKCDNGLGLDYGAGCTTIFECLSKHTLSTSVIPVDTQYKIKITTGDDIEPTCDGRHAGESINANLTIHCGILEETINTTVISTDNVKNGFLFDFGNGVTWLFLCIVLSTILMVVYGKINSKYLSGSDDFRFISVCLFGIYMWDMFSDILFSISLWNAYVSPNHTQDYNDTKIQIQSNAMVVFIALFVASIISVLFPLIKNFKDLIIFQSIWINDKLHGERLASWFNQYSTIFFMLSFLCGSPFGAVLLVNSRLITAKLFTMGLTQQHLREFNQKRLINVIVAENIPQLIINCTYSYICNGMTTISFLAIMSSLLSISVSVLDHISNKKLIDDFNKKQSFFSFVVFSNNQENKTSNQFKLMNYKHKTKKLGYKLAKIFKGLDKKSIEMLPSKQYIHRKHGDGLIIYFCIWTSIKNPNELYIELKDAAKLHDNEKISFLGKEILKGWNVKENIVLVIRDIIWIKEEETVTETTGTIEGVTSTTVEGVTSTTVDNDVEIVYNETEMQPTVT